MRKIIFLNIIFSFLMVGACAISNDKNAVTVKFTEVAVTGSNSPRYELIFFEDGKRVAKRIYESGRIVQSEGKIPDGMVIEKFDNDQVKNILTYKNGKRNGAAFGFYRSGRLKAEGNYKDDNPIGVGKKYYENGTLMAEWEIVDGKEIYHHEYYDNGKLKEQ